MTPYEITYKIGNYENTIVVQADNSVQAEKLAWELKRIPLKAEITRVRERP